MICVNTTSLVKLLHVMLYIYCTYLLNTLLTKMPTIMLVVSDQNIMEYLNTVLTL